MPNVSFKYSGCKSPSIQVFKERIMGTCMHVINQKASEFTKQNNEV